MVYSNVMNRWLYSFNDSLKKSLVFKDGYDDPTYMTFRIEFGDWGASILDRKLIKNGVTEFSPSFTDYDALPMGLLNCPASDESDNMYWQNNAKEDYTVFNNTKLYSAFQYLRSRNEDTRAKYLFYFVNGLYEIQHDYPYIFKKISGLKELEKFDPLTGQRLKAPAKISLECYEGLDLRIRTLFEFYRKAAWDDVYQRWILPENMREFKMIIYVFERRIFLDVKAFEDLGTTYSLMEYGSLNADIPVKAYECVPCEFDIQESMSWGDDYDQTFEKLAETSKLVIKVKNVKTYFKNGLLTDTLAKTYATNGNANIENNLSFKLDSIMIYDLVENIERTGGKSFNYDNTSDNPNSFTNMSVNAAKALFLNKDILLENEESNYKYRAYVWGRSYGGAVTSDSTYGSALTNAELKIYGNPIEDNTPYRGGWVYTLADGVKYDSSKSLWSNIKSGVKKVLTGARRLILISGNTYIQYIDNCLEDTFFIPPYAYSPIENYNNGLGHKPRRPKKHSVLKDSEYSLGDIKNFPDIAIETMDNGLGNNTNTAPEYEIKDPNIKINDTNENNNLGSNEIVKLELEVNNNLGKNEINPKANIEDNKTGLGSNETIKPDLEFNNGLGHNTLNDSISEYNNGLGDSELIDGKYKPRHIYPQKFEDLDDPREIKELKFKNLDNPRTTPDLKYENLEEAREIPEQKYKSLDGVRDTSIDLTDIEFISRTLPEFKDKPLEEIRKIPELDFLQLVEATKRSMPSLRTDKSVIIETIEKVEGSNVKLLELDKENDKTEKLLLDTLKSNTALLKIKVINDKEIDTDDKLRNLKSQLAFTQEFVLNADKVKLALAKSVIEKKLELKNITKDIVSKLPLEDSYILKNGQSDFNGSSSVIMSENDKDQINHNMSFLSINDNDVEKLSFNTLIQIHDNIDEAIERSKATVGLTKVVKDTIVDKKEKIDPKKSVIEEPKKDKMQVIY